MVIDVQSNLVPNACAYQMSIKSTLVPDCVFLQTWQVSSLIQSFEDVAATLIDFFFFFCNLIFNL